MVRVESTMLPLGTPAADYALPDVDGRIVRRSDGAGAPALVVMSLSNHCPYVKHIQAALTSLVREYQARGVAFVAIASNDTSTHPQDGPAEMKREAERLGWTFPYLHDASQAVAKAYRAACTPDFYVHDAAGLLVYRGQMDGARPGNDQPNDGADLRAALDAVLAGRTPIASQRPSMGCNIKWKAGGEPDYFPPRA